MFQAASAKLAQTLLVLLIVSAASFAFLKLAPGDPVSIMLGSDYSKSSYDQLTHELGLDQPTRDFLRTPVRQIRFTVPVRMDDGQVRVFHASRVQHNDARGPCRGGLRVSALGR